MTIDAKKLEEALDAWRRDGRPVLVRHSGVIEEAARAHLATLPRTKEVEIVQWAVLDGEHIQSAWDGEDFARAASRDIPGTQVVRLSAIATVPA